MATSFDKLKEALPSSWFSKDDSKFINAILKGFAWCCDLIDNTLAEVKKQTRILTATGGFLELISGDFFGDSVPRHLNESDNTYSSRLVSTILKEKVTPLALSTVVNELMGGAGVTVKISDTPSIDSFKSYKFVFPSGQNSANTLDFISIEMRTAIGGADECYPALSQGATYSGNADFAFQIGYLFDNNAYSKYSPSSSIDRYIIFNFATAKKIIEYAILIGDVTRYPGISKAPSNWYVYGSNDNGVTWTQIDRKTNQYSSWTHNDQQCVFTMPSYADKVIPHGAYPVGLDFAKNSNFSDRWNSILEDFEAVVIVTGLGLSPSTLQMENSVGGDSPIELEDGSNILSETIDYNSFQYLWDAIMAVKPIGTVVWVSLS